MPKILFISEQGNGCDRAWRMKQEGGDVRLCILNKDESENFDGMIEKTKDWRANLNWCDFVYFDDNGKTKKAGGLLSNEIKNTVGKMGIPAYGMGHNPKVFNLSDVKFQGFSCAEVLEFERAVSQDLIHSLKMGEKIESQDFSDISQAIKYLQSNKGPYVIKPECNTDDKGKTFVGRKEDNSDTIGILETYHLRPDAGQIKRIELQKVIDGVECAVSSWFNGKEFIGGVNINFEHKLTFAGDKLHPKGMGFNCGEQGTVMKYDVKKEYNNFLFKKVLEPLGDILKDFNYRGQIDSNCRITKDGIYLLEFTPRDGYPASFIEDEAQITSWCDLCGSIAFGENIKSEVSPDWCIGVVACPEAYPFWDEAEKRNYGLKIDEEQIKRIGAEHLHFGTVKKAKEGMILTGGYPGTYTAKHKTLEGAINKIYGEYIGADDKCLFPNQWQRPDIGKNTIHDLELLKEWGYNIGVE
jgi:phosphoribosylamine--glycine ligase